MIRSSATRGTERESLDRAAGGRAINSERGGGCEPPGSGLPPGAALSAVPLTVEEPQAAAHAAAQLTASAGARRRSRSGAGLDAPTRGPGPDAVVRIIDATGQLSSLVRPARFTPLRSDDVFEFFYGEP